MGAAHNPRVGRLAHGAVRARQHRASRGSRVRKSIGRWCWPRRWCRGWRIRTTEPPECQGVCRLWEKKKPQSGALAAQTRFLRRGHGPHNGSEDSGIIRGPRCATLVFGRRVWRSRSQPNGSAPTQPIPCHNRPQRPAQHSGGTSTQPWLSSGTPSKGVSAHTCRYSPRSTRTAVAPSSWRSWRTGGTPTTATPRCCRSSRRRSASWSGSRSASASTSRSSRRRSLPSRPTTGCRAPIQRRACASISISSRTRFARRILAERTITSACGCSSRRRGSGARSWSSDQDKASGAVLPFACGMAVQVLASALRGLGWRRGHSSLRTRLRRFQCTACLCLSPRRPLPCPAPHGSTHSQPPGPESR